MFEFGVLSYGHVKLALNWDIRKSSMLEMSCQKKMHDFPWCRKHDSAEEEIKGRPGIYSRACTVQIYHALWVWQADRALYFP